MGTFLRHTFSEFATLPHIDTLEAATYGDLMTTIHVQSVGDKALVPQVEFARLIELAQRNEQIAVHVQEDDVPTLGMMRLAELGGAFDFWREAGEEVYSTTDGEPV